MFTGLIQGQGSIRQIQRQGQQVRLEIALEQLWEKRELGESIAVDGVCLTVEKWADNGTWFSAYASTETLQVSTLGEKGSGSQVNLERALALGERLGGHLVSGHVDTVATVISVKKVGESHQYRLEFDPLHSSQVIPKGSITLDGISLTVNACGPGYLEVNIIPATWQETSIKRWRSGTRVNLETDLIGKYISSVLGNYLAQGGTASGENKSSTGTGITMDFLRQNGF